MDGWDGLEKRAYEFHSCHWHGCPVCRPNRTQVRRPGDKTYDEVYADTVRHSGFLQNLLDGRLVEMLECEWGCLKRNDSGIRRFLADRLGVLPLQGKRTVSSLDTFVECDIKGPQNTPVPFDPSRDLWADVFDKMCPLFFNADVGIDDVGPPMKIYAEERSELKRSRRLLVAERKAGKVLLITPLFRW